jgi:hypothetical protein
LVLGYTGRIQQYPTSCPQREEGKPAPARARMRDLTLSNPSGEVKEMLQEQSEKFPEVHTVVWLVRLLSIVTFN